MARAVDSEGARLKLWDVVSLRTFHKPYSAVVVAIRDDGAIRLRDTDGIFFWRTPAEIRGLDWVKQPATDEVKP